MTRWKESDLPASIRERIVGSLHQPISPNGPKAHKYGAKEVWVDNVRFGSALEAGHYEQLKLLKQAGAIRYFIRQVRFELGGGVRHFVDWMIVRPGCEPLFAESKGSDLPMGRAKRKAREGPIRHRHHFVENQTSNAGVARMHLIRQADGERPTEYAVVSAELPRAWRWDSHLGGGYSAVGRTPEEAEMLLRDALAYGKSWVSRAPVVA